MGRPRARHRSRPGRLRLDRRQCRERQRHPEIHARRQVRRPDRQDRAEPWKQRTTQLGKPAETALDKDANEIYVADGYGNRRVIVFDATTLAYKRHWGAYGNKPDDNKQAAYDPKAPVSQQFGNPVHCVKIANDGLVYVCDRINNRIQVFKKDGTFVKEFFFEKNTLGNGAVWDIAIWPDPQQTWLLSADGENNEIRIIKREDGSVLGSFGHNGRNAGQFHWVHAMAVDAKGNVYTAEVDTGKRIQKFKLTSDALR
jgi:DNA-binding beta-propeller fold protein YncE